MAARKKTVAAASETKTVETKSAPTVEVKAAPTAEKKSVPVAEKKPAAKRACKKVSIELQFGEKCIDVASLEGMAVAEWAEATGKAKTALKNINLYVKPEENMLYYVIEGESGKVEL